jgi:hypothetical protein
MRIHKLKAKNYRTLEDVEISFPSYYCAISGKNNSGKTNVLRALRLFFGDEPQTFFFFSFEPRARVSFKEDFPAWVASKDGPARTIQVECELKILRESDAGLYQFLVDYLDLKQPPDVLNVQLATTTTDSTDAVISASINGNSIDARKAQEVLKKIQSSPAVLFHNSTGPEMPMVVARRVGSLAELGNPEREELEKAKDRLNGTLTKIAKRQQKDVSEILGRLQEKHKVGFSITKFDPDKFPYSLTLGDGGPEIAIENWGSGTQNQTLILMALFRAKRISELEASPSKITPVIVIEEPESFLHPSAQGEFGRLIQALAEEFKVQVIVTTHSHYMLSTDRPECNILLERERGDRGRLRRTTVADTSGEQWMEPFSLALGLDNEHFRPWKSALFSSADRILLVEGETDKAYFELLKEPIHGDRQFKFDGFIYPYNGRDQIRNRALIGLLKCRYKRFFITYDLDSDKELSKLFDELGLQRGKHYLPIGKDAAGKDAIEGLLPDSVLKVVYGTHVDLVQQLAGTSRDQRESARSKLKRLLLDEFKRIAAPGDEHYGHFYSIVRKIDAAMV